MAAKKKPTKKPTKKADQIPLDVLEARLVRLGNIVKRRRAAR